MLANAMAVLMITLAPLSVAPAPGTDDTAKDAEAKPAAKPSFLGFVVNDINGKETKLDRYSGKVCLVVNVASRCGLTPQYAGLEMLYRKYAGRGLKIVAFPANNFGKQEPGTNPEIKQFCTSKFDVTFDLFAKVSVKGKDQCPLYRFLTNHPNSEIAGDVQWNFQKYLVGRDGKVIAKFSPRTKPDDERLVEALEAALDASK